MEPHACPPEDRLTSSAVTRTKMMDDAIVTRDGPRPESPLDQIVAVVSLLFDVGLALNSIQQSAMSDHDTQRTSDAVAALDTAVRKLRSLAVTVTATV